jgi:UDP-N-acetylglucosamine--N-acetylmuramyl-(pentapeptide) pyrophosphoryl-undecaprenol N-acetylglucosamine transferase
MREPRPAALLAMGSYASVGPVTAARRLGVPYVLHEANVIPGRAVRWCARGAAVVGCSFEETRFHLRIPSLTHTGMPLRKELENAAIVARHEWSDVFRVLVMGGSAGAHVLNEVVTEALCHLHRQGKTLRVVHLTGNQDRESVQDRYTDAGVEAEVLAFSSDMGGIYAETDLAICRAGASTCAELALFKVPALMVPYPYAANDHQTANARALEKAGTADVVAEKDLSAPWLEEYLAAVIDDRRRLDRMRAALKGRVTPNAADRLADLVEGVALGTGTAS